MTQVVFKESQKFNQPLLWGIILSAYLLTHVMGIRDIVGELAEGDNWWASEAFIAAFIGLVLLNLLVVLFLLLRLETRIDRHGVYFRYPPVITSWRKIPYVEIQSIEVVRYSPWAYGGWGIRYNWHGWAYNVRGNKGIMIKKKNGKQLLIGTQKSLEAQETINQLMREEKY